MAGVIWRKAGPLLFAVAVAPIFTPEVELRDLHILRRGRSSADLIRERRAGARRLNQR